MLEESYPSMDSSERMGDLQDGQNYSELPRHQARMISHQPSMFPEEYDDSYDDTEKEEEDSEGDKRYQELPEQELTEEQIDKIYGDLKAKKRRILDCLLKTIPDHLKTKAKRICDTWKTKTAYSFYPAMKLISMEKLIVALTFVIWSWTNCWNQQRLDASNTKCLKTRTNY